LLLSPSRYALQGAGFRSDERALCRFSRLNPSTETTVTKTTKSTYVSSTEVKCDAPSWEEDSCPSCAGATALSGTFSGHTGSPYLRSTSNLVNTEIGVGDYIQFAGSSVQPGSSGYLTQYFQVKAIEACTGAGCVCSATWQENQYSVAKTYNGTGAPGQPANSGFEVVTPSQTGCALYQYDTKNGGASDSTSSVPIQQRPSYSGEDCTPVCSGAWTAGTKITLSESVYKIDGMANVAFSARQAFRATKYSCTGCKCHGGCKVTVSLSNDGKAYSGGGIGGKVWSGSGASFSLKDVVASVSSISLSLSGYRDSSRIFGPASGGTTIYVSGSNFQSSPLLRCYFAGVHTLVKATWISAEKITCKTPSFYSRQLDVDQVQSNQDGSVTNPHTKVHVTNDGMISDPEVEGTVGLHISRSPHLQDDGTASYIRTSAIGSCGSPYNGATCNTYTSAQEVFQGNPHRSTCQQGLYPNEGNEPCYGSHGSTVLKADATGAEVVGTYSAGNDVLFKYATCYDSNPAGSVPSIDKYGASATGQKTFNASSVYGAKFKILAADNKDGPLTALDLELNKPGNEATTFEVKICAGDFCEKGGQSMSAATIIVSKIVPANVDYAYKVYFNTPAYLLSGLDYYLQVKYVSGAADTQWKFNTASSEGYYADSGQTIGAQFRWKGYTCDGCRTKYEFNPATPQIDLKAGDNPPTQEGGLSIYQSELSSTADWGTLNTIRQARANRDQNSMASRSMLAQEFRPSETGTVTHATLNLKSETHLGVSQAYVSVWITKHAKYGEYVCSVFAGSQNAAETFCDTDMDGIYDNSCAVGAVCNPDNALNGGCGDSGACTLVETATNGHRLRPETGGVAGPCGHSSTCSITMTLAPDAYKVVSAVDGDVTFEFKTPVPVEKHTTYFVNMAVVGNVDISKPVIWKSGRACGDGGANACTAPNYYGVGLVKDSNTEAPELRHTFKTNTLTGNWEKQTGRVFGIKFTRCVSATAQVHSFTTSGDKVGCCSARASPQGGDRGAMITITGRNFFPSDHLACIFRNEDGSLGAKTTGTVTDASYTTMTCPAPTLNPHSSRDCSNPTLCQGTELVVTNDGYVAGPQFLGPKWNTGTPGSNGALSYLGLNPMKFLFTELHVSVTGSDTVGDGTEARPFLTIQKGVDASNEYDQIVLFAGTYVGLGNRGLRHHGKKIGLKAIASASVLDVIIDCQHAPDGFILNNNKDSDSPFAGFIDTQDIVTRNCENLRIYDQ